MVDCVYSFLHNGGARFIPSPEGEGSSLPLHPDVINTFYQLIKLIIPWLRIAARSRAGDARTPGGPEAR
ncbi:MAG: hypothetical protein WBH08_08455 [Methanothrix sp.]